MVAKVFNSSGLKEVFRGIFTSLDSKWCSKQAQGAALQQCLLVWSRFTSLT